MSIRHSPGCQCCGGCEIATGTPETLLTGNDHSLGTAKNNSKFSGPLLDFATSVYPATNGDTMTLKFGSVVTFTFGIEDERTLMPAVTCPDPVVEQTLFVRTHYVTDGTRKFILRRNSYYINGNVPDNDSLSTPLVFPKFKVRDGFVEFLSTVTGGMNYAEDVEYDEWIPYEYTVDGEAMTVQAPDTLEIAAWMYEWVRSECDCDCVPFKPECPEDYTCKTVSNWISIPYSHSLTIPSVTLPVSTDEFFAGCASSTTWDDDATDIRPNTFYTKDTYSIQTSYAGSAYVGTQFDGLDYVGGGCDTWDGTTCTFVNDDDSDCEFVCPNPPYDTVSTFGEVTVIINFPQQGKWMCNVALAQESLNLTCDDTNCVGEFDLYEVIYEYNQLAGCLTNCDIDVPEFPPPACLDAEVACRVNETDTRSCSDTAYSSFSGTWTLGDQTHVVTTDIHSELTEVELVIIPANQFLIEGDRSYNSSTDTLGGGAIKEKDSSGNWFFVHQRHIPLLVSNPSAQEIADMVTIMSGASDTYYYDVEDTPDPVRWKFVVDATGETLETADPHPWVEPEVQYGIGAIVTLGFPQASAVDYSGQINGTLRCSFSECDELPGTLVDENDPSICGSWTQTITYANGVEESRDPPTDALDYGPWSSVLASCSNAATVTAPGSPGVDEEWFTTITYTDQQIVTYLPLDSNDLYCSDVALLCKAGYVERTCDIQTNELTGVWDRQLTKQEEVIDHAWSTYDVTAAFGASSLSDFIVAFPKRWNDCWSDLAGPTVSWTGDERIDQVSTLTRYTSVTLTSTGSTASGPTGTLVVASTPVDLDGISLTATAHPTLP